MPRSQNSESRDLPISFYADTLYQISTNFLEKKILHVS